jgi:imidazolonepropionase-like amidohydrolase
VLLGTSVAAGQSRQVPAPAQHDPAIIHSGTVHTVSGERIDNGYVIFDEGRIVAVGAGAPPAYAPDARLYDASGLHVYPGLISSNTTLGLTEVGAVDVTNDHTELGRFKPEVRAAVAINPDSDLIPVARANGILTAMILPNGGLVSGRSSTIRLDGWTWENMAIDPEAGLVINWPRTEPRTGWWVTKSDEEQRKDIAEDLEAVERVFDDAAAYLDAKDAGSSIETDLRYEAMRPALRGAKPVYVRANAPGQIESAVAWAKRRGLRIVIIGGRQAQHVIPLLVEHDIAVIVNGLHRLPSGRHAAYDEPFVLPSQLHEAGVPFCIASGTGAAHERNLNHNAATAAAYGLPKAEALKAVTLHAANVLGLGATHGSLETGKSATLIVTTGDPLEITTDVLIAFIDGRRIDLGSRHKSMYAKYRQKYQQLGLIE